jgi:hypothetical protein
MLLVSAANRTLKAPPPAATDSQLKKPLPDRGRRIRRVPTLFYVEALLVPFTVNARPEAALMALDDGNQIGAILRATAVTDPV